MEQQMYPVLHYKEFFKKYNRTYEDSRFINKSYSQSNNCVLIYKDELIYDVFLQCPDFGEHKVPEDRRYIYVLKKGEYNNLPFNVNKDSKGKDRISININDLEVFADPYLDFKDNVAQEEDSLEAKLIKTMKKLIEEYEQERNKN